MTPEEIDAGPDYTPAQQLKLWMQASIDLAQTGKSYAIANRSLTRNDAKEVISMIEFWQGQAADEETADTGAGIALAKYGERV